MLGRVSPMRTTLLTRLVAPPLFMISSMFPGPLALAPAAADVPAQFWAYFGTYSGGKSQGIYVARFDTRTGALADPVLAAESRNPSFLAVHPNRRFLYAVGEVNRVDDRPGGGVSAFAIDGATGRLRALNRQSSGGAGPCHLACDGEGRHLLVANYGGGSVSVLPLDAEGRLGEATAFVQHRGSSVNRQRQEGPHAHWIEVDPANRFAWVADLGLDKLLAYRFDPSRGTLTPHEPPAVSLKPGAGPRHFAFAPDGTRGYAINELDSTITAFRYEASAGRLIELGSVSTLPEGYTGDSTTAEIAVHPSGRFVYGSNRGHDSLAVFAVEAATGRLKLVEHVPTQGKTPRNFALEPGGRFLLAANQASDSVVVFRVDPETGRLTATGAPIVVGNPVCIVFVPAP